MPVQSIKENIQDPFYYHREHANDFQDPQEFNKIERTAIAVLPFLSQYKPLSLLLSSAMGSARTWTCGQQLLASFRKGKSKEASYHILQTTIAVLSVAGTIFAHPVGMVVTTGQDLVIEVSNLITHLQARDHRRAIESCAKIINNSFYLALMLRGGIELTIASLAFQIMLGIYQSQAEFRAGNYIEGSSHFLLVCVRGNQMNAQVKLLQHKWKLEEIQKAEAKSIALQGRANYAEMIQRATDQEKAALAKKLEELPRKDHQIQRLLQALKEGNWDSDIFANVDYPYYALEALRNGTLSTSEFATVQIFWEIHQAHDKKFSNFVRFFNEDGSVNRDTKGLVREILRPKYADEKDPLLDSKIYQLFEKMKSYSKSQQGIWLISDKIKAEELLFSGLPMSENHICRKLWVEDIADAKVQQKLLSAPFVQCVPSYDLMQVYLDVYYGKWAVRLNPILGLSTDSDTYQNSMQGRRNISFHHPAVFIPHRADGFEAPWYEFSCFHDFAYHATECSTFPKELAQAIARLSQLSDPEGRLENLRIVWMDLNIPEFLRMKDGFSLNDSFWARIANSFNVAVSASDPSFRERVLKLIVSEFATQPLLQEGPQQALAAYIKKREQTIQGLQSTIKENPDLYFMERIDENIDVLKMMLDIWAKKDIL